MSPAQYTQYIFRAAVLAGAALLTSCGAGGGDLALGERQAGQGVAVGEPNGAAPVTAEFVAQAQAAPCAEQRNRLFMIDKRMVFWDRAGNCADNGYARTLYGATPQQILCSAADSIAGPRTFCNDESARALFNTIDANRHKADLGLGSGHLVEPIDVPPRA
jgi:hypothetical protein